MGRVRATETDDILIPYGWKFDQSKYPAVWLHGSGAASGKIGPIEHRLNETLNIPMIGTDHLPTSDPWQMRDLGRDAVTGPGGAIEQDAQYLVTNYGAKPGKRGIIGGSMGGLDGLLHALENPDEVAWVVVSIPAGDPEYVRLNDQEPTLANKQAIEYNFGAGVVPTAKRPFLRGADYAALNVPTLVIYTENDVYAPQELTEQFIADSGCESFLLEPTSTPDPDDEYGHNYVVPEFPLDLVVEFIAEHVS
jgi:pimeloyl-ACP methyl ester carboxylesterase